MLAQRILGLQGFAHELEKVIADTLCRSRGGGFDTDRLHRAVEECVIEFMLLPPLHGLQFIDECNTDCDAGEAQSICMEESCAAQREALKRKLDANDELMRTYGVHRILTTPYHPQANGIVGRLHGFMRGSIAAMSTAIGHVGTVCCRWLRLLTAPRRWASRASHPFA